jgi:RecA/RadA recombinase
MGIVDKLLAKMDNSEGFKLSDKKSFDESKWVSTGIGALDFNIGGFGFPPGIIELAGSSRSGKSTISLTAMAQHQKKYPNGLRIILSTEERENRDYSENIGVDTSDVIVIRSRFVEDLFYKFQQNLDLLEKVWIEEKLEGNPKVFAMLDSAGALNSRADLFTFQENVAAHKKSSEKGTKMEMKHAKIGDFAKAFKGCMKAILAQLYEKDIIFVILNHTYSSIGNGVSTQISTGGKAIEYLPNLRCRMDRVGDERLDIDGVPEIVGQRSKLTIIKNDWGGRRVTNLHILLGYGFVLSDEDIEYAVQKNILKKEGEKKFSFMDGKLKWNSTRTFYQLYKDKNKLLPLLNSKIIKERHKDVIELKKLEK